MLKLRQLQKQKQEAAAHSQEQALSQSSAQRRLEKDLDDLDLPPNIQIEFPVKSDKSNFVINIIPDEGYYRSGRFQVDVSVGENYPISPPKCKFRGVIYHPNIDLQGNICLNILREDWTPVLNIQSIVIGLLFLFQEPNANDPLNKDAANMLYQDPTTFGRNVTTTLRGGSIRDGISYSNFCFR